MSIARRHRVHLLTVPVEGLVVEAGLIDTATVPVDWAGTTTVIAVVTARRLPWVIASPWIRTSCSEPDTEQPGNTDSGRERRCR